MPDSVDLTQVEPEAWPTWAKAGATLIMVWGSGFVFLVMAGLQAFSLPRWLEAPLAYPGSITADSRGRIYAYIPLFQRVHAYDSRGRFLEACQTEQRGGPAHLLVDDNDQWRIVYGAGSLPPGYRGRHYVDRRGRHYVIGWRCGISVLKRFGGGDSRLTIWGAYWWLPFMPHALPGALALLGLVALHQRILGRPISRVFRSFLPRGRPEA